MFPGHFKNFIFLNARTVDSHAYGGEGALEQMRTRANATLKFFVDFCHSHGIVGVSGIRHRRRRSGHGALRRYQQRLSQCYFFHQQADFRTGQLVHAPAARSGRTGNPATLAFRRLANGDIADEGTARTKHPDYQRPDVLCAGVHSAKKSIPGRSRPGATYAADTQVVPRTGPCQLSDACSNPAPATLSTPDESCYGRQVLTTARTFSAQKR